MMKKRSRVHPTRREFVQTTAGAAVYATAFQTDGKKLASPLSKPDVLVCGAGCRTAAAPIGSTTRGESIVD
jgi:hypothetical protein